MDTEDLSQLLLVMQLLKHELPAELGYDRGLAHFEDRISLCPDTRVLDDFLSWISAEIESQEIRTGERVFSLPEGRLLIPSEVIESYMTRHQGMTREILFSGLPNYMGLAKKGGSDYKFDQLFSKGSHSFLSSTEGSLIVTAQLVTKSALTNTIEKAQDLHRPFLKPGSPPSRG